MRWATPSVSTRARARARTHARTHARTRTTARPPARTHARTHAALTVWLRCADWLTLTALIALTVADTVLCTVNLYYYTDTYAQYFNQGTGAVYILVSIPIVLYNRAQQKRRRRERDSSQLQGLLGKEVEKPGPPLWILIAIGALNGTGNFFNAIGSPHTRANTQSLLQLLGLPIVLLLSWLCLAKRPSGVAACGALLIVLGTVASAAPTLAPGLFPCGGALMPPCPAAASSGSGESGGDGGGASFHQEWYSVVIYFGSTLFYSTEKVFEESTFHRHTIDIFYMFFWTLVTQVMLGWVYYPIQVFPAFGGLHLSQIPSVIWDGALCTIGITAAHRPECDGNDCPDAAECAGKIPLLFFVYCAVDYSCYAMGLYVIQRGGE